MWRRRWAKARASSRMKHRRIIFCMSCARRSGDTIRLFNGRDGEWLASVAEVSKRSCVLICRQSLAPQSHVPDIWLVFAPIKKTPADYVVQKATELGVRRLQPVFTRRTIVTRVNLERMRANAVEAAEQSERLDVPEIGEPQSLNALLRAGRKAAPSSSATRPVKRRLSRRPWPTSKTARARS